MACSTPEACSWDPKWASLHEISGRAMKNVHESHEGFQLGTEGDAELPAAAQQLPAANGHPQANGHAAAVH